MSDAEGPCIIWAGPLDRAGYGRMSFGRLAHRVTYEASKGPIPAGLELDHLCVVPACVNPDHLEPVTHAENMARAKRRGAFPLPPECKNGHEFTTENTYLRPASGGRTCRTCNRDAARRYKDRRSA